MDLLDIENAGINYNEGLERFANNQALYEKFLFKFKNDPNFSDLQKYIKEEDWENAFKSAHALKGISGNLSLENIYDTTRKIVEDLRINKTNNITELNNELINYYNKCIEVLQKY